MTTASHDARAVLRVLGDQPRTLPDLASTLDAPPGDLEVTCSQLLASGQLVQLGDPTCPLLATPAAAHRAGVRAAERLQRERRAGRVEAHRKRQQRARR